MSVKEYISLPENASYFDNIKQLLRERERNSANVTSWHNNIILVIGGAIGATIPTALNAFDVRSNLPFPAENIAKCFIGGLASALLVFLGLMLYELMICEASTAEEPNWKKAGMNALLSFVTSTVVIGGQELAHHFLPKLPEYTITIYAVGVIGLALIHALAIPKIEEKILS